MNHSSKYSRELIPLFSSISYQSMDALQTPNLQEKKLHVVMFPWLAICHLIPMVQYHLSISLYPSQKQGIQNLFCFTMITLLIGYRKFQKNLGIPTVKYLRFSLVHSFISPPKVRPTEVLLDERERSESIFNAMNPEDFTRVTDTLVHGYSDRGIFEWEFIW